MNFGFSDEQEMLRASARRFLETECLTRFVRRMIAEHVSYAKQQVPHAWQAAEVAYFFAIWAYLIFQARLSPGPPFAGYQGLSPGWYFTALAARFLTVGLLAAYVVKDILYSERDVVRAHGLDDPAGGVLDQAPDRFRIRLSWPVSAG